MKDTCYCIYRYDDPDNPFFFEDADSAMFVMKYINPEYRDRYKVEKCMSPFMDPCEAIDRINMFENKYGE